MSTPRKTPPERDQDRHEIVSKMEPLRVELRVLDDLALALAQKAAAFRSSLPPSLVDPLAGLVRSTNCYYSNLIEGRNTLPVDIERALRKNYSADPGKRDLQLEAAAHIAVQEWIDRGGLPGPPSSVESICEIHRRFCAALPEELLWVENPDTGKRLRVVPGELRTHDVRVGRHEAISPGAVPRFLERFSTVYGGLGDMDTIVATAAAHHRLVWIHPFTDGNGRVARLVSHAMLQDKLKSGALWSVARGLARSVEEYKAHLQACDEPRRGDRDGGGNLSEAALLDFTRYFLERSIDQVDYMKGLMQPATLRERLVAWLDGEVRAKRLNHNARSIVEVVLVRHELPKMELPAVTGLVERQARRVAKELTDLGVLIADTPASPLKLGFPPALAPNWMPNLYPTGPAGG